MSGARRRSNVTAPICPMNCTRIRVVINASITMPSDTNPARIERTPSTTSETYGNPPAGILDFVADIADIVVAEVVVDADPRRGAEAQKKTEREIESARRKVEGDPGVEVQRTGHDDHDDGDDGSHPERDGDRRNRRDPPVEECQVRDPDERHDEDRLARGEPLPDVAEVLREAEVPGRDTEGATDHKLPREGNA